MTTLLELTKKLHNTLALYNGAGHALGWKTEKVDKLLDESKRVIELAEQPAPVQQGGLEMVDDEGENQAVRMFLALYGGACGVTSEQMRKHLTMAGFDGAWPEWANSNNGHLTKAGAQLWIRHLFALEQPVQQEPVAFSQFLSDVVTAAGLLSHGKTDKSLAARISEFAFRLRTSPPASKPWVGLTDEQIAEIATSDPLAWANLNTVENRQYFARAIEAKLKEKNT